MYSYKLSLEIYFLLIVRKDDIPYRNGGNTPRILDLGIRRRQALTFTAPTTLLPSKQLSVCGRQEFVQLLQIVWMQWEQETFLLLWGIPADIRGEQTSLSAS